MAHNLETVNGKASFFSNRLPAWHNLGIVVDGAQTWEQACELANMNFQVTKEQNLHPRTGEALPTWNIYRSDNDAFLGVVGEQYTPVQNRFVFEFMDKVLGEGGAHYETAGVLGKGERIFVLANLEQKADIHGKGDIHKSYLSGVASHDGSSSVKFFATDVRIVCQNTLNLALGKAKGKGVNVRHTRNAESNIMKNLSLVQQARHEFASTMEKLEALAERKVNGEIVAKSLGELFKVEDLTKDIPARTMGAIVSIKELFESNDNDAFPEFRGTGYNLVNAVTEYTDHFKEVRMTSGRQGMTQEVVRSDSAMFGLGADWKKSFLDIVIENTKTAQRIEQHKTYSIGGGVVDGKAVLDSILSLN